MHCVSPFVEFEVQDVWNQSDAVTQEAYGRSTDARADNELAVQRQRLELVASAGVGVRLFRDLAFAVLKRHQRTFHRPEEGSIDLWGSRGRP